MTSAPFTTLPEFRLTLSSAAGPDVSARQAAAARNGMLTKPPGALGRLEELAIWYAGWQGTDLPRIAAPQIVVFAGNHGVAAQGISAFPAAVTAQMVANFEADGAAINQLARLHEARMDVVALSLDTPVTDFTQGPAMAPAECVAALSAGWCAVDPRADLLIVGEMGIGNTTSAAAIAHALCGGAATDWVGRGTGLDDEGLARKAEVVASGIATNPFAAEDPLEALRCLGGREIAAMAGAMARARMLCLPVLLDGFICTAAAAVLHRAVPGSLDHCIAGHLSAEGGHAALLQAIGLSPLLSLGLRLGEGSGAAVALGVLKAALACHSGMATFAEAGVADG